MARILLFFLLLISVAGQAQHRYWDADYDSLRLVLSQQQDDTARLRTIVHLVDLSRLDEDRERKYALVLLDELVAINHNLSVLDDSPYRMLRQGVAFWMDGTQNEQALSAIKQAVVLFDHTNRPIPRLLIEVAPLYNRLNQVEERYIFYRDKLAYYRVRGAKENIAACYLSLGGYYRRKGAYNQAISNYLRAAELFKSFDQRYYISELKVAGANYAEWGNTTKALQYLRQSVDLAKQYEQQGGGGVDAYTLRSISKLYLRQQNNSAALRYADLSLAVRGKATLNEKEDRAYGLVQKGLVLLQMKDAAKAQKVLQEAQHLADSLHISIVGRRQGEFELTAAWAEFYMISNQPKQAEAFWQTAYQQATNNKLSVLRKNYLRRLSNFYDARKEPARSQFYSRTYMALADSMSAAQGAYHLAQYEGERLEQAQSAQIANLRQAHAVQEVRLRQRNQLLGGAIGAIVLVSGLGGLVYWQLRRNKRVLRQLRQTQNQLVASEKWAFVGELSAGIAHELQNPLSFMKKFAEVSTAMIDDMPHQSHPQNGKLEQEILAGLKQNLQEISQHGLRASSIIKDMLEHSRAGTGLREQTNLNALVEEYLRLAYQSLQGQDKSFRAELTTTLDPALVPVSVVTQDMGRVLLNLFTNAFHAVRQRQKQEEAGYHPTVSVQTRQLPGHIEVRVHDNGTGIPEAARSRIFEPFFTTKAVGEGTGLGLSLSFDIVKAHGGTLRVESQEGEGTEFSIILPV